MQHGCLRFLPGSVQLYDMRRSLVISPCDLKLRVGQTDSSRSQAHSLITEKTTLHKAQVGI